MTDVEREMINDALVQSGGRRTIAAGYLGWSLEKLRFKISKCRVLKERWAFPKGAAASFRRGTPTMTMEPPSPEETISRDLPNTAEIKNGKAEGKGPGPSPQDLELARAMRAEDQKVRQGLSNMGLEKKELEIAIALQQFDRDCFRESIQIIGAGATRMALKIQTAADVIIERLNNVRSKLAIGDPVKADESLESRKAWVEEERGLMAALVDVADLARKMMEVAYKGALIRATIEQNANHKIAPMKRAAPGFRREVDV